MLEEVELVKGLVLGEGERERGKKKEKERGRERGRERECPNRNFKYAKIYLRYRKIEKQALA